MASLLLASLPQSLPDAPPARAFVASRHYHPEEEEEKEQGEKGNGRVDQQKQQKSGGKKHLKHHERTFANNQYAAIYTARLAALRPEARKAAEAEWANKTQQSQSQPQSQSQGLGEGGGSTNGGEKGVVVLDEGLTMIGDVIFADDVLGAAALQKQMEIDVAKVLSDVPAEADAAVVAAAAAKAAAGQAEDKKECDIVITGTLFKEMPLVARLLRTFADERGVEPLPGRRSFISDTDACFIEDAVGRVQLVFPVSEDRSGEPSHGVSKLSEYIVTGVVAAVRGRARADGCFVVSGIVYPGPPPQVPLFRPSQNSRKSKSPGVLPPGNYVAFVSGMQIGHPSADLAHRQMLVEFLTGSGGTPDLQEGVGRIGRVIIAGNSLCPPAALESGVPRERRPVISGQSCVLNDPSIPYEAQETRILTDSIRELDLLLAQLAVAVSVDIMPGAADPSAVALPQPPLNRFLFPDSSQFTTLRSVWNPHEAVLSSAAGTEADDASEIVIQGSSGEPIHNLMQFAQHSGGDDTQTRLDLLAQSLEWRHLAPTAPTELACYPYESHDPFILERCPHVLFSGNQPEFATRMVNSRGGQVTRLLLLPEFASTSTIVLLNTGTLDVIPFCFSAF